MKNLLAVIGIAALFVAAFMAANYFDQSNLTEAIEKQGREAARTGAPATANPFRGNWTASGQRRAAEWLDGWIEGKQESTP